MKKILRDSCYIMYDGTTYYGVLGIDVDDEIADNDAEVVYGPFSNGQFNDDYSPLNKKIEKLNNELNEATNKKTNKKISLTEKQLHCIIKESVKKIISEGAKKDKRRRITY